LVNLLKEKEEDLDFEEFHLQETIFQNRLTSEMEDVQENNEAHESTEGKHPLLTYLLNSWAQLAEEQKVILFSASETNTP
jgi:hypothetical protein